VTGNQSGLFNGHGDLTGGKRSHFVFADFIQSVPDPRTRGCWASASANGDGLLLSNQHDEPLPSGDGLTERMPSLKDYQSRPARCARESSETKSMAQGWPGHVDLGNDAACQ